jgi:hypothetical protein
VTDDALPECVLEAPSLVVTVKVNMVDGSDRVLAEEHFSRNESPLGSVSTAIAARVGRLNAEPAVEPSANVGVWVVVSGTGAVPS